MLINRQAGNYSLNKDLQLKNKASSKGLSTEATLNDKLSLKVQHLSSMALNNPEKNNEKGIEGISDSSDSIEEVNGNVEAN